MRITRSVVLLTVAAAAFAGALVYSTTEHAALAPALTVDGQDVYVAFVRFDRSFKLGKVTLSTKEGGQAILPSPVTVSWRTNETFGLTTRSGVIYLAYVDYQNSKIMLASFSAGDKVKSLSTRSTSYTSRGGVSAAADGDRVYVCFTGEKEDLVKVATYTTAAGGKMSVENQRDLAECNTVLGASAAVTNGTLVVAWVNAEKKIIMTTYEIERSSKGTSYNFLKEIRTEIKVRTEPLDKPAVAAADGEVYLGYVDKNDKTVHIKFYTLETDGNLKSGGEARVNERPDQPIAVAPGSGGKILTAYVDVNRALYLADK